MITSLQNLQYYEKLYDDHTISICRGGEQLINEAMSETEKKVPAAELSDRRAGWYLMYSLFYFRWVETPAAMRYAAREEAIMKMMEHDRQKDEKLASASLAKTPYCLSCGKDMEIISRDYMRRKGAGPDTEDILLMFECQACNKRIAYWPDGTKWEGVDIKCEKCGGEVTRTSSTKKKILTTVNTCQACGHVENNTIDLREKPKKGEPVDPYYELDYKRFIFDEARAMKFRERARHLERLFDLHANAVERTEYADVYTMVKDVKQLKIAQLSELLAPVLADSKFTEFKLGSPNVGREVSLDFSCLDADPSRDEHTSKKNLHKLFDQTLADTNWRLMSEGVNCRLGYLTGRLRAYESEEDIKKLVEQRVKAGELELKPVERPKLPKDNEFEGRNLREAALVYMDKMYLCSKPAKMTLKSGREKETSVPYIEAEMNPLLRVMIPAREGDESVPKFVRSYDFKMSGKDKIPRVSYDDLGREIRLT